MKKLILIAFFFIAISVNAQQSYWTYYNFTVEPQNEAAVLKLVEDYFKEHKPDGVTVRFFENHFHDGGNNYTHSIGFSGSLDAMGNQYECPPPCSFARFRWLLPKMGRWSALNSCRKEGIKG